MIQDLKCSSQCISSLFALKIEVFINLRVPFWFMSLQHWGAPNTSNIPPAHQLHAACFEKLCKSISRSRLTSLKSPQSRAASPPRHQNGPNGPCQGHHGPHHQHQQGVGQEGAHEGCQRSSPPLAVSLPKLNTIQVGWGGIVLGDPLYEGSTLTCLFFKS